MKDKIEINTYSNQYNEESFLSKCAKYAGDIGKEAVGQALNLYYALDSKSCSAADKTTIYGSLAYLVSPIDLIPDLTPFIGYSDDIAVIAWALKSVIGCIDSEVHAKTAKKINEWFE